MIENSYPYKSASLEFYSTGYQGCRIYCYSIASYPVINTAVNKGKDWGPAQLEKEKGSDLGCVLEAFQMLGL